MEKICKSFFFLVVEPIYILAHLTSCQTAGPFSEGHHQCHPAVSRLCETLDLSHSCGYVTLLNPHREEAREEDELDLGSPPLDANQSADPRFDS